MNESDAKCGNTFDELGRIYCDAIRTPFGKFAGKFSAIGAGDGKWIFDVVIIGQGYAGLTAARIAADRGLRVASIEGGCMGGLIININGFDPAPENLTLGAQLAGNLAMANMDSGVVTITISDTVISVGRERDLWKVKTESETCAAPHVVVASGARLRKLGVPGEEQFFGRGVSECAAVMAPVVDMTETVVVGGGDSAFQEALSLSQFASKVVGA